MTEINKNIVVKAFMDIRPKKIQFVKKPIALAASIFLSLFLFGGIVYSGFSRSISLAPSSAKITPVPVNEVSGDRIDNEITYKDTVYSGPNAVIPSSVVQFLEKYKLTKYEKPFYEALKSKRFDELTREIYDETGYMLVALNHIESSIKQKYGALKDNSSLKDPPKYYLFWRPHIILKKFYYYYEGEEVLELQKIMAKMRLYTARLDGKVGKNLMMAVVNFQKQMGLPVTGFPDTNTIFLLCHEVESLKNDA